jgi:hypothetical protein
LSVTLSGLQQGAFNAIVYGVVPVVTGLTPGASFCYSLAATQIILGINEFPSLLMKISRLLLIGGHDSISHRLFGRLDGFNIGRDDQPISSCVMFFCVL